MADIHQRTIYTSTPLRLAFFCAYGSHIVTDMPARLVPSDYQTGIHAS